MWLIRTLHFLQRFPGSRFFRESILRGYRHVFLSLFDFYKFVKTRVALQPSRASVVCKQSLYVFMYVDWFEGNMDSHFFSDMVLYLYLFCSLFFIFVYLVAWAMIF